MDGPVVADLIRKSRLSLSDPDQVAVVFRDEQRTFAELDERSDRLAAGMLAHGLAPGDRVAILSHNRLEYIELFLAIAKAGLVAVPLNYLLRGPELAYHIDDSGAETTFVEARFLDLLRPLAAARDSHRLVVFDGPAAAGELHFDELLSAGADTSVLPAVSTEDVVLLQYTSGTTGRPKGATHTQGGVVGNAVNQVMDLPIREDDVYLSLPALCWAAGLHTGTLAWLLKGARVVIYPSRAFDPDEVCATVEAAGVTAMLMVPVVLRAIFTSGAIERHNLSGLHTVIVGGEPVSGELLDGLQRALPDLELLQAFGQSEFPTVMTALGGRSARSKAGSVGKAVGLTRLRVIDEHGVDAEPGAHGEIVCRSAATMQGYWNQPEETKAAFTDGWLRTGDRGWVDEDGYLYIAGRSKDMMISGGLNVYPAEIERVLLGHPAVAECAVIGVPDEQFGEVGCAYVVPRADVALTQDMLAQYCREQLASYKMPRHWVFRDENLPRTASGKIQKFRLAS